jgi:hypothetical protein
MLHIAALTRHTGGGIASAGQGTLNPVNNFLRKKAILFKKTLDNVNLDVVCCSRKQEGGV